MCTNSALAYWDLTDEIPVDALITGEKPVGAIVNDLSMSQPQVSKHLRVLSEVGLVRCRAERRRRLYRLEPARLPTSAVSRVVGQIRAAVE
jgi:DNA-binding transcriptional ArsR family regulator